MERLDKAINTISDIYTEYLLSETDIVDIRTYDEALQDVHTLMQLYKETGLTPEEIEQNKEYIQILEKENKLIKEQYIKEADAVDYYKKLATENTELKELLKLAFEDIRGIVNGMEECELCKNNDVGENIKYCDKHDFDCKNCEVLQDCKCGQCKGTNNWQWQHADKLKELGVKV